MSSHDRVIAALALLAAFTTSLELAAQDSTPRVVRGTVIDPFDRRVSYVNVLAARGRRTVGDDSGRFSAELEPQGTATLEFRRHGYHSIKIQLNPAGDTSFLVEMAPLVRLFDSKAMADADAPIRILELHGFYTRLQQHDEGLIGGIFFTGEDLVDKRANRTTQLFDKIPGLVVFHASPSAPSWQVSGKGGCPIALYLDDQFAADLSQPTQTNDVDRLVAPVSIAGLEIYLRDAPFPVMFEPPITFCGSVVIWTK
jgi:hypothetical protein